MNNMTQQELEDIHIYIELPKFTQLEKAHVNLYENADDNAQRPAFNQLLMT